MTELTKKEEQVILVDVSRTRIIGVSPASIMSIALEIYSIELEGGGFDENQY